MACDHHRSHVVDSRKKEGFVYRKRICSCGQHIFTREYLVGEQNKGTSPKNQQDIPNILSELESIMGLACQIGGTKQRIFSLFVRKIQIKLGVKDEEPNLDSYKPKGAFWFSEEFSEEEDL